MAAAETTPSPPPTETRLVRVWDAPVRLVHWLLVVLIGFSWWSAENHEMEWHRWSGYTILGLLVFRIFWGFAGSRTARFAQFLRGPTEVIAYAGKLTTRPSAEADGHNPLGGWSVIALLLAIGTMVTAGLFAIDVDGLESGPLADYISFDQGRTAAEIHEVVFNALIALIAVHIAAVVFYLAWHRRNLIGPMITGHRKVSISDKAADARAPAWKAAVGVVVAALCVYAVSTGFRL